MKKILIALFLIGSVAYGQVAMMSGGVPEAASAEKLTNGALTGGTSWAEYETDWFLRGDSAAYMDVNSANGIEQTAGQMVSITEDNVAYTVEFDISISSGDAVLAFSSTDNAFYVVPTSFANGHHSVDFTAPADVGNGDFRVAGYNSSDNAWGIDNLSLKQR